MSQIRKKNIMDNALQQNMIDVARHYYTPLEMALSEDVLQDIVGITGLMNAPPVGGEVRGHARTISLQRVLASPNVYPVGEGSHQVRAFCQIYDSEKATVMINGNEVTNGMIRELAIRKFFVVHDIQISDAVSKSTLASGKHMKRNNDNMIVACACLAITRSVFGEQRACFELAKPNEIGAISGKSACVLHDGASAGCDVLYGAQPTHVTRSSDNSEEGHESFGGLSQGQTKGKRSMERGKGSLSFAITTTTRREHLRIGRANAEWNRSSISTVVYVL
jgi:hypothetical protein